MGAFHQERKEVELNLPFSPQLQCGQPCLPRQPGGSSLCAPPGAGLLPASQPLHLPKERGLPRTLGRAVDTASERVDWNL